MWTTWIWNECLLMPWCAHLPYLAVHFAHCSNCIRRLLTIKTITLCPTVSNHHWSLILLCLLTVDGRSAQTHVSNDCWILNCNFCSSAFSTASRVGSNYVSLFFPFSAGGFYLLLIFFYLIKKLLIICVRTFLWQTFINFRQMIFFPRFRWMWQKI